MSIIGSISNCRKPIGEGADRAAYYSKRYKCVIKRSKPDSDCLAAGLQMKNEIALFKRMTEDEKIVFPIIDALEYKGEQVILMKRAKPLKSFKVIDRDYYQEYGPYVESETELRAICQYLGISTKCIGRFMRFVRKYQLFDLHIGNIGVMNNKLVIIDAGLYEGCERYSPIYSSQKSENIFRSSSSFKTLSGCQCSFCRGHH